MMRGPYDVAQICLNRHVINDSVKRLPQLNRPFCDRCGAKTITNCQECNADIPGYYYKPRGAGETLRVVPAFCSNCGAPFPWTEKALEAARELTSELDGLTEHEKALLAKDLDDIIADTPRTRLAAVRWKKALSKISEEVARAVRDILIEIASETARKQLGL